MATRKAQLELAGPLSVRDRLWSAMRALRCFTYQELYRRAIRGPSDRGAADAGGQMERYVRSLERAGYLRGSAGKPGQERSFELVRDPGVEAPRVDKHGRVIVRGAAQTALWRTMKILRIFTVVELAHAASTEALKVGEETTRRYVRFLERARYLVVRKDLGASTAHYEFMRSRDTGPLAPEIRSKAHVYDPNRGEVAWYPEERA